MPILSALITLLIYLAATIIIEVFVAFLIGYRKKDFLIIVALGSVITNPVLNVLILIYVFITYSYIPFLWLIILEVIVVYVEFGILYYVFKNKHSVKELLIVSFVINSASFITGYFLREVLLDFFTVYFIVV